MWLQVSLGPNQLFGRLQMLLMQPSRYPDKPYASHMSHRRMHAYTILQFSVFALMYVVKSVKQIAIAFPLVIAACIPMRSYVLPRLFSSHELALLDGAEHEARYPSNLLLTYF